MGFLDALRNPPGPTHLCRACGNAVEPREASNLNGCFFIVLLFAFVVPGILYLVWASSTKKKLLCPICNAENTVIPIGAPAAQQVNRGQSQLPSSSARIERSCPWCAEPILQAARICKHCGRDV